ncbi:putative ATP-grasp-modified RiPP [Streptomyces carpaticus]|uniref:putative ATP-grasp-modified RiPP n=1 Tax=Streptomyces TaxID=1883 RepID=UPI00220AE032|nr:putative ATP-grasp-modified RiPP [Streptomyces carpaticus]
MSKIALTPSRVEGDGPQQRPFGLRTARPITPENTLVVPDTTYCPERQLALTHDGVPVVTAGSTGTTNATGGGQTQQDMQWFDDSVDDSDVDAPEEEE